MKSITNITYKCPVCNSMLLFDWETISEIVFYCPSCGKYVKARK